MKTNFAVAALAAAYLAFSVQGKGLIHRFLNNTCNPSADAKMQTFAANYDKESSEA